MRDRFMNSGLFLFIFQFETKVEWLELDYSIKTILSKEHKLGKREKEGEMRQKFNGLSSIVQLKQTLQKRTKLKKNQSIWK